MARILLPQGCGTVDVYVSHFQAQYVDDDSHAVAVRHGARSGDDEFREQRVLQAWETAHFIRLTRRSALTLFLGDMNAGPDHLVYRVSQAWPGGARITTLASHTA